MKNIFRKNRGFSLVEILVAVLLVGILMAVAVPRLLGSRQAAADSAAKQQLENVVNEAMSMMADQDSFSGANAANLKNLVPDITLYDNAATTDTGSIRGVSVGTPGPASWRGAVRGGDVTVGGASGYRCWVIELNKTSPTRYATYNVTSGGCSTTAAVLSTTAGCISTSPTVSGGWYCGTWPARIS